MAEQRTIFDAIRSRELARTSDPATSKSAAAAMVESGALASTLDHVWQLLRARQDSTARELARTHEDYDNAHKRLPELERLGFVVRVGTRRCSVTNRPATVWRALPRALAEASA